MGNGGFDVAHAYWRLSGKSISEVSSGDLLVRHIERLRLSYKFVQDRHKYVSRVYDWPYSSFRHHVARGLLPPDWGGDVADITGAFGE